jgi:ATP-dependent protease Clp ATPase subunit
MTELTNQNVLMIGSSHSGKTNAEVQELVDDLPPRRRSFYFSSAAMTELGNQNVLIIGSSGSGKSTADLKELVDDLTPRRR